MILVRHAGTPQETQRNMRIGGDLARQALFQEADRPSIGDEIRCDLFDEPRLVTRVDPVLPGPDVLYWKAAIIPRSEWNRLHAIIQPRPIAMPSTIEPEERPTSDPSNESRTESVSARKARPGRRNPKYEQIDKALRQIAEARPNNHKEVFGLLDGRGIPLPRAVPFLGAKGWLAAFQKDDHAAHVWLSKAWARLNLPSFPRGPK